MIFYCLSYIQINDFFHLWCMLGGSVKIGIRSNPFQFKGQTNFEALCMIEQV